MADRLTMVIGGVMIEVGIIAVGILISGGNLSVAGMILGVVMGVVMICSGVAVLGSERIAEALSDRFPTHERRR